MKIERKKSPAAEVYTASLNDILFFLLLFFLIISTLITPMAIRVMLPQSSTSKQVATRKNINLVVTRDLKYYIDDREITFDGIEPALVSISSSLSEEEKPKVLLQADRLLDLQSVIRVLDIVNKLQLETILFTEKD